MRHGKYKLGCTPKRWEAIAREEAAKGGLDPVKLLAGRQSRPYVLARWRAWKRLVDADFSYASIGRASGFDHTSVRYGTLQGYRERLTLQRYGRVPLTELQVA